jgi:predicted flap endonuclease-1-like 5' DNA nuclease
MANKKITDVEGIGPVIGEKFVSAGVKDSDGLLAGCKTPALRKALAEKAGLSEKQVLRFANMADLYRVKGIGSEYADLLEAAGVDTVPELARRKPDNLCKSMTELNAAKKLVRRVPNETEVADWVAQAKGLPRMLEY